MDHLTIIAIACIIATITAITILLWKRKKKREKIKQQILEMLP